MAANAVITGWGMAVPRRRMTNDDLARLVDTSDDWIRTRTGIAARYVAGEGESTATLGAAAARQALACAGRDGAEIDLIVCATSTPEHFFPSTACVIQPQIGADRAAAFDVGAACTGFVYGLAVGAQFIVGGLYRRVLVIGADTLTRLLDWSDRGTCVLFGDGAGAVVLEASSDPGGLLTLELGADGRRADQLIVPAGGSHQPLTAANVGTPAQYIQMAGREIFRFGVRIMVESTHQALARAGLGLDDIDLLVPHQANERIITAAAEQLGLPMARVMTNVDRYGNTSSASIPIALCEAVASGRLRPGDRVLMIGMGGGLTWGAALVEWTHAPVAANGHAGQPVAETALVDE